MDINQFIDILKNNPKGSAYILTIISRLDFIIKSCWNKYEYAESVKQNMEDDGKKITAMDVFGTRDFMCALETYNRNHNDDFSRHLSSELFIYTNDKFSALKKMIFNVSSMRHWLEHRGCPRCTENICKTPNDMFHDLFLMLPSRFSNEVIMRFCRKLNGSHRETIFNELQGIKNKANDIHRKFIQNLNRNLSRNTLAKYKQLQQEANCAANYDLLGFMKRFIFVGGSDGIRLLRSCVMGATQFMAQNDKYPRAWYHGTNTDITKIRNSIKKSFQTDGKLKIPFDECEMIFDFVLGIHSVFCEYYSGCVEWANKTTPLRNNLAHSHLFFDHTERYLTSVQNHMAEALKFFDDNRQYCAPGVKRDFAKSMRGLCKHNDWCCLIAKTNITTDDGNSVCNAQRYNIPLTSMEKSTYADYGKKFGFDNKSKIKRAHISKCIKEKITMVKNNPNHANTQFCKIRSAKYLYFFRKYAYRVIVDVIKNDINDRNQS